MPDSLARYSTPSVLAEPDPDTQVASEPSSRRRFPATASVRLKQEEAERLREAADALDLSVSSLLRQVALQYLSSTQ